MIAALALLVPAAVQANILSWSGGSGTTGNWSDTANWGFSGPPASGDTLIFPAAQPRLNNTNNIPGLVLAQIRFAGPGGGYVISGNAFTLTNGIAATNTAGANTLSNALTLATIDQPVTVGSGVSLSLAGQLSGSVGVVKSGAGTLTYTCTGSNPYTGTTRVNAGLLQLNVSGTSAVGGALIIGDGSGTAAIVRHLQGSEISDSAAVTIYNGGTLDLNNFNDIIGTSLTLNGGTAQSGSGTLTLSANNTITVNSSGIITGNLNIGNGTCALVANGTLTISAAISGSASITKSGAGWVYFNSANSYSGLTVIQTGILWIQDSLGLGSAASGTVVSNGASLVMSGGIGVTNESLTLNGPGVSSNWGALDVESAGTNIWAGPITVNADSTITPYGTTTTLRIIGPISGAGGVEKFPNSSGTLWFEGNTANTYAGLTKIIAGTNILAKTGGLDSTIPHDLQIGDATHGATVRYLNPNQIPNGSIVTLYDYCLLDLNNFWDGFGGLVMYGSTVQMGTGFLDVYSPGTITSYSSTNAQSVISGRLGLQTPTTLQTVTLPGMAGYLYQLEVYAQIYGSQPLTVTGVGPLFVTTSLYASNTFTGPVIVSSGFLRAENDNALGTTGSGTVVSNGAGLALWGSIHVGNEPLTLHGFLEAGLFTNSWAGPITFATNAIILVGNTPDTQFTLSGALGGPGGFTKTGPGSLILAGPDNSSTYLGDTTVNEGVLGLQSYNVIRHGTLTIGDGWGGANADVVRYFRDFGIFGGGGGVNVVVRGTGLLDLNGFSDDVGPITMDSGKIATGTGTLTLFPPLVSSWNQPTNSGWSIIQGNLALSTASNLFEVVYGGLWVEASVSGPVGASLIKSGIDTMYLHGSNSYAGLTVVQQGSLSVENSFALGATNAGTVVSNAGILSLSGSTGITNEALTLNTTVGPMGGLDSFAGTNIWAGPITVNGPCVLASWNPGDSLRVIGPISGPGGVQTLSSDPTGKLFFEGPVANTYAGDTVVPSGTLLLNKSGNDGAIPHGLRIGGTVRLLAASQISDSADVLISGGGLLDLGAVGEYIDTLHGAGTVHFGTGGYIGVGMSGGTSQFDGSMTGVGFAGGWTLSKWGSGTFTVTGANTYSVGKTEVFGGRLVVNSSLPAQSAVVVDSGATLAGNGIVGNILGNGLVAPGNSPGILTSSNVTFSATGAFNAELAGLTPGSGYDQLNVNGTVALGNANLQLNMSVVGSTNAQFTIINNDSADAVTGSFAGLPEGGIMTASNGAQFQITYQGGSGNDVVLTQISLPAQPQFSDILKLGNGGMQLDGTGMTNLTYTVWANTNVTTPNWLNIGTATANGSGVLQFTDLNATNYPMRFYRFSWP